MLLRNYQWETEEKLILDETGSLAVPGMAQCRSWEAARCTSCAPTYFDPMIVKFFLFFSNILNFQSFNNMYRWIFLIVGKVLWLYYILMRY